MGSLSNTSLIHWRCWWIGCRNIGGHFLEFILLTQAVESLCYGLFQDHKVCWWNQVANHRLFQLTVGLVPANCANFPCVHMALRLPQKVITHSNSWHTNFRKLRRAFRCCRWYLPQVPSVRHASHTKDISMRSQRKLHKNAEANSVQPNQTKCNKNDSGHNAVIAIHKESDHHYCHDLQWLTAFTLH
jgi:hypothetical protein